LRQNRCKKFCSGVPEHAAVKVNFLGAGLELRDRFATGPPRAIFIPGAILVRLVRLLTVQYNLLLASSLNRSAICFLFASVHEGPLEA
jgi:hypothetical protein